VAARFGQPDPDWFYTLPREQQTRLLAWWRITHEPAPGRGDNRERGPLRATAAGRAWFFGDGGGDG